MGRDISGVAHHMVLRADVLVNMERAVALRHKKPLWAALLGPEGVLQNPQSNAFSEYQLYFHYARRKFPESVNVRQLYWANGPGPRSVVECASDGWPVESQPGPHKGHCREFDGAR